MTQPLESLTAPTRMFADAALDLRFAQEGYVTVPWLTDDLVAELRSRFVPEPDREGFYTTMHSASPERRRAVSAAIGAVTDDAVARLLPSYAAVARQFAVKPPESGQGAVGWHQDWSVVDEAAVVPVVIWCPLRDVDERTGALSVIPRSHRLAPRPRPNTAAEHYDSPLLDVVAELVRRHARCVPLRAGEAIVYHPGILHASGIHHGATERVAVILGCAPRGSALRHYFRVEPGAVDIYDVDPDFFFERARVCEAPAQLAPVRREAEHTARLCWEDVAASGVYSD